MVDTNIICDTVGAPSVNPPSGLRTEPLIFVCHSALTTRNACSGDMPYMKSGVAEFESAIVSLFGVETDCPSPFLRSHLRPYALVVAATLLPPAGCSDHHHRLCNRTAPPIVRYLLVGIHDHRSPLFSTFYRLHTSISVYPQLPSPLQSLRKTLTIAHHYFSKKTHNKPLLVEDSLISQNAPSRVWLPVPATSRQEACLPLSALTSTFVAHSSP